MKRQKLLLAVALVTLLFSCTTAPVRQTADSRSVCIARDDGSVLSRYAPAFLIENDKEEYNLIGTPTAEMDENGKENIYVDPQQASIYGEIRDFATANGTYTNLVYRIHFEKVPGGLDPYHLTKGKNVGLLVIVTLNIRNEPILYTTVHTCGCYLSFIPTSYLPADKRPDGWKMERQTVYGENLPAVLAYDGTSTDRAKTVILIRDGTHRVKDVWLSDADSLTKYNAIETDLKPLVSLEAIPLKPHGTTSFYETSGCRKGYVKGSHKIRERLYMGWWALDWRIGEDKKFGRYKNGDIVFYTSLKPWDREKSDMRDFVTFLKYWHWNL